MLTLDPLGAFEQIKRPRLNGYAGLQAWQF